MLKVNVLPYSHISKQFVVPYNTFLLRAYRDVYVMEQYKNYFLKLNIFEKSSGSNEEIDEDPYEQRTQVVATRVYFILLVLILFIFLLVTCLNSETITNTVQNPTFDQIKSLPANRICPCSRISFSYDKFVSSNASFHQVCSSDFVSDRWISSLFYGLNASYLLHFDFRSVGFAQFQALASFCRLSRASVNETRLLFGSSLFISSYFDSSSIDLHTKVMTTFNRFNSSMSITFKSRIQLISTIIRGNQFLNALETNIIPYYSNTPDAWYPLPKEILYFPVPYARTADGFKCFCTQSEIFTDENCRCPSGIFEEHFDIDIFLLDKEWYVPTVFIPGFISSCMPVDACLLSSLECFFNQSCVNGIFPYQRMIDGVMWNFTALNSNNTLKSSRFNINSTIKSIVDELMVEEWFIQEQDLYEKYFQQCAPVVCTYLTNVYPDFLSVLNVFVGLLGGLCSGLHLIVLPVVRFIRKRLFPPPANPDPSQSPPISCE
jgi:hypothetical protein